MSKIFCPPLYVGHWLATLRYASRRLSDGLFFQPEGALCLTIGQSSPLWDERIFLEAVARSPETVDDSPVLTVSPLFPGQNPRVPVWVAKEGRWFPIADFPLTVLPGEAFFTEAPTIGGMGRVWCFQAEWLIHRRRETVLWSPFRAVPRGSTMLVDADHNDLPIYEGHRIPFLPPETNIVTGMFLDGLGNLQQFQVIGTVGSAVKVSADRSKWRH